MNIKYDWIKKEGVYGKNILRINGIDFKIITRSKKYDLYIAYEAYKDGACVARSNRWRIFIKRLDKISQKENKGA
jgi:hypothetical protein